MFDLKELARAYLKKDNYHKLSPVNILRDYLPKKHRSKLNYEHFVFAKSNHCYPGNTKKTKTILCTNQTTFALLMEYLGYQYRDISRTMEFYSVVRLSQGRSSTWYKAEFTLLNTFKPEAKYRHVEDGYDKNNKFNCKPIDSDNSLDSSAGNHSNHGLFDDMEFDDVIPADEPLDADTLTSPVPPIKLEEDNDMITDAAVQIFNKGDFEIRAMEIDGEILFPSTESAKKLGYTDPDQAIRRHCSDPSKQRVQTENGVREILFIDESDLYMLIMRSNLPKAKEFQKWVCREVLPSIRQNGSYSMKPLTLEDQLRIIAQGTIETTRRINQLEQSISPVIKELPPKVENHEERLITVEEDHLDNRLTKNSEDKIYDLLVQKAKFYGCVMFIGKIQREIKKEYLSRQNDKWSNVKEKYAEEVKMLVNSWKPTDLDYQSAKNWWETHLKKQSDGKPEPRFIPYYISWCQYLLKQKEK